MVRSRRQIALVCIMLLGVVGVFVSPDVDLAPTALRAAQAAIALFAALVLGSTVLAGRCHLPFHSAEVLTSWFVASGPCSDLVDLNCTRLC